MIWQSIPLMTLFDIVFMMIAVASLRVLYRQRRILTQSHLLIGAWVVVGGLFLIGLFYFADLIVMWELPLFVPHARVLAVMQELQLNYSWGVMVAATLSILVGFSYLMQGMFEQATKLEAEVTGREQAEASLGIPQFALDHAADPVYWVRQDGRIFYANKAACESLGYSRDELLSMSVPEIEPNFSKEDWPAHWQEMKKSGRLTFEAHHRTKDGRVFPVEITTNYLTYGSHEFVWDYVRDITKRKRLEEDLRQSQRREVELAEAKLAELKTELVHQTRLATIGQMTASIAHEIRNPLATVRNAAYYLKRHIPKNNPKLPQYLGIIDQEVHTADRVIRDMLEMAHSKEPVQESFDLSHIVLEVFNQMGAKASVRCHLVCSPDPYMIVADRGQLRQVIGNLVSNSIQATTGKDEIIVDIRQADDHDLIAVRDNGPGVDQEHRDRIFEPLYTTKAKGTGLGLTICRQIVERHGGTIEYQSHEDSGALFCVRLPRHAA